MTHGLSCSAACGVILDKGWDLCLMRWQADSLPRSNRGSPGLIFFFFTIKFSGQNLRVILSLSFLSHIESIRKSLRLSFQNRIWALHSISLAALLIGPLPSLCQGHLNGHLAGLPAPIPDSPSPPRHRHLQSGLNTAAGGRCFET